MEDKRIRYPALCPVCGKIIYVCKSIAMEMGMQLGSGACCFCNSFLHLSFGDNKMKAEKFEDWKEKRQMETMRAILHTAGKSDADILRTGGMITEKDIPLIKAMYNAWDGAEVVVRKESLTMLKTSDAPYKYNLVGWDEKDDQLDKKVREAIYLMEQDPVFGTYTNNREAFDYAWDEKEYEPAAGITFYPEDVEIVAENNAQRLARLILQNPGISVIPMVDYEICAGDECQYWAGGIEIARVREYIFKDDGYGEETIFYKSEASKLVDAVAEKADEEEPQETEPAFVAPDPHFVAKETKAEKKAKEERRKEKYEEARQQAWKKVNEMKWEKALFVYIGMPE